MSARGRELRELRERLAKLEATLCDRGRCFHVPECARAASTTKSEDGEESPRYFDDHGVPVAELPNVAELTLARLRRDLEVFEDLLGDDANAGDCMLPLELRQIRDAIRTGEGPAWSRAQRDVLRERSRDGVGRKVAWKPAEGPIDETVERLLKARGKRLDKIRELTEARAREGRTRLQAPAEAVR